ncbi:MAG: DEAD/DEAH box helicase family protein, partial [Euryarchaeota archaeon]|nr:DEAD/DEAH box helicase family protein [Euryarchaeota archaeon]
MYVEHALIKPRSIVERDYQIALANSCLKDPTLLVLPTGLGKTVIALRVAAEILHTKGGKVLFLAPTKPLVAQIASYFNEHLIGAPVGILTGDRLPSKRKDIWSQSDVLVATPQSIANDLENAYIDLEKVSLIIYDEAHRAVGNYAYVNVAKHEHNALVLGMTASPGATRERIITVCNNLGIESLEWRNDDDEDVVPHIHDMDIEVIEVEPPEYMLEVQDLLQRLQNSSINFLVKMRFMKSGHPATIPYLLQVEKNIQSRFKRGASGYLFRAMSANAAAMKVAHAIELAGRQSTFALNKYIEKLKQEGESKGGSRASKQLAKSTELYDIEKLLENADEHPKMKVIDRLVRNQLLKDPSSKVIIFTNYRDSCDAVVELISSIPGIGVDRLVGQTNRGRDQGQSQDEQVEVLERLRNGSISVIVATCIGEEGLDVANTDLVIFYEPVPSEIRSIQRRGRTGRSRAGQVII